MGIFKAFTFLQGLACPHLVDKARTDSESIVPFKGKMAADSGNYLLTHL